jgi:hypothetical protein
MGWRPRYDGKDPLPATATWTGRRESNASDHPKRHRFIEQAYPTNKADDLPDFLRRQQRTARVDQRATMQWDQHLL